jgi:hypothetical protein
MIHKCNISRLLKRNEDQLDVDLFKHLCIQLSWASLHGILSMYKNDILHCDLSVDNILFTGMATICILVYVIGGLLLGWILHAHLNIVIE